MPGLDSDLQGSQVLPYHSTVPGTCTCTISSYHVHALYHPTRYMHYIILLCTCTIQYILLWYVHTSKSTRKTWYHSHVEAEPFDSHSPPPSSSWNGACRERFITS